MSKKRNSSSTGFNLATLTMLSLLFSTSGFANDYIESAKEYLAKNEMNYAIIELKNAIKQSPEDGYARYLLGDIFLEQGDFFSAEQQLYRALKYDHDKDIVSLAIARALINQNKLEDAFLFINELYPEDSETPADLIALTAIAEIKLRNLDSAKILLEKIKEKTLYTEMAKALYSFVLKEKDQALIRVNTLLKTYDSDSDLWLLKGNIETSLDDINAAYESYLNAYKFAPKAHQYNFYIARSLVQLRRFDEASPIIDKLLSVNKENPYVNELKAITLFTEKNYSASKLHADRALNNGINNFRLLAISGVSAFNLNQLEHSYITFKKLAPQLTNNHPINRLYIITQFKLGYIDDAIENIENFKIESIEDSEFLSQISVELTKIGRNDLALKFAKKASAKAQGNTEAILNFVKLANDDSSGIDDLLTFVEKQPSSIKVKQGLANYYLMEGKIDEAEKIANEWLESSPNDIVALSIKALINKKQGKIEAAKSYFEKVKQLDAKNLQAIMELSQIESIKNNNKGASALLKEAKFLDPSNHKVSTVFLDFHKKAGTLAEAIKIIDDQIKDAPLNEQLKIQKANALVMNRDRDSAIILLESLANKDKRVWKTLSLIYIANKDKNNTKRSLEEWLKIDQFNPIAYLNNIGFLLKENALVDTMRVINQAQKTFPNDARFMLTKTETLLKQGENKLANDEFNNIPSSAKNGAQYLRILGMIQVANKDFDAAVKTYTQRFESSPSSKLALELTSVYLMNKQQSDAINFLDKLVSKYNDSRNPQFLRLKLMLAQLTMNSNPNKSIKLYSDIVEIQPNNAVVLNNLSWVLFEQNQIEKACAIAQKAHNLASESVNIADTYGYCLLKSGDTTKALNLLEFAYEGKKADPQIALHFAEALIEAKQIDKAAKVLANISTTVPDIMAAKNSLEKTVTSLTQ